jgi:hypothetical protein
MFTATQLVAHMLGDYVFQTHTMAARKTSSLPWALLHASVYTVVFALFFGLSWALLPICLTHAVIDRYRLARHWCEWWGVGRGHGGKLWLRLVLLFGGVMSGSLEGACRVKRLARPDPPPFLAVWLLIIVDNTWHVCINAACLWWLG